MNRLTLEERRRVLLAQQRAHQTMLARLHAEPVEASVAGANPRGLRWIARAVMTAALLGGGLLAAQTLEFHPPDSLVEAMLPRL